MKTQNFYSLGILPAEPISTITNEPMPPRWAVERASLRDSLLVLLAWCVTFLNDEKHLIGSVCKQADDAQFKAAIEQARAALGE